MGRRTRSFCSVASASRLAPCASSVNANWAAGETCSGGAAGGLASTLLRQSVVLSDQTSSFPVAHYHHRRPRSRLNSPPSMTDMGAAHSHGSARSSYYGALPSAQMAFVKHTQNSHAPFLADSSFSEELGERSVGGVTRMRLLTRGMAALVLLAFAVTIVAGSVWRGDSATLQRLSGLTLRQQKDIDATRPSQVHIALFDTTYKQATTHGGIAVSWATSASTKQSLVRFGRTPSELSTLVEASSPCTQYEFCEYTSPWFHHVVLDGAMLEPSTTYFYQCGDQSGGWSELLTFTTPASVGSSQPVTFAVIGDLGQTEFSQQTVRHLVNQPNITAILHAGDLSYADSFQPRWDSWGKLVEPLSSTCPWMVSAGNHEEERPCQQNVDRFVAYQQRFRMPYNQQDAMQRENLYFGFRTGMVHFIVLTPYVPSDPTSPQYKWLEQELERIDRNLTPWVVVMMHGPWYNSNTAHQGHEPHVDMKAHMEDILFRYKVDLVLSGHVHAYERSYAVYKEQIRPDGIVYVVLGDGGNREGLAPTYIHPKPVWSAFRQANYGFGLFHVVNRTHARIEMYEDQEMGDAKLHDSAWLSTTAFRVANNRVAAALLQ